ncbi:hypothetical protein [Rhizobium sp. BK176]|uniref:hypothetical protein n=1 Tax=Rhizobium sp. BK176 TaxID=2587071 RepID=UPI0021681B0E|nr:hypothetical protein [Rhizobium sp. BK176]MCS4088803.1 hypothetical protein [Rhizobium sp. BK176]
MLVHLPHERLLNLSANKLSEILSEEYGVKAGSKKAKDTVAKMLGFESFEDFQVNNLPVSRSEWNEPGTETDTQARYRQYARILLGEKFKGVDASAAEGIVSRVAPENIQRSELVLLQPAHTERWADIRVTEGKLVGGAGCRATPTVYLASRLLGDINETDDDGYSGNSVLQRDASSQFSTVVVAVTRNGGPAIVGHITYKTQVDVSRLIHRVEISERFIDYTRLENFGWTTSDADHALGEAMTSIIHDDVARRHSTLWNSRSDDYGTLHIVIDYDRKNWKDILWAASLIETLYSLVGDHGWWPDNGYDDDLHPFPRYKISLEGNEEGTRKLPAFDRTFITPNGHVAQLLALFDKAADQRARDKRSINMAGELFVRLDYQNRTCSIMRTTYDGSEVLKPVEVRVSEPGVVDVTTNRQEAIAHNKMLSLAAGECGAKMLELCHGKNQLIFYGGKGAAGRLVMVDEETWLSGAWDAAKSGASWLDFNPSDPSPSHRVHLQALNELLGVPLRNYVSSAA